MARAFLRPPAAAAAGHAKKSALPAYAERTPSGARKGFEPSRLPTRTSNVRVCQFRHPRITSRGAGFGAVGELLDYNSTTRPKVKPGNHICGLSYKNPGGISCTVSLCRQEAFYAAILPYTPGRGALAAAGRRQRRRGFALGVAASRPAPLSQAAVIPTPPPAGQPAPGRGPGGSSLPGAAPPASQAELPPLVCLTFDDGPSRTTPAVLAALEEAEVPATFFVVANENNESYLPLIRQAAQAGCEIALHSASHRYSDIYPQRQRLLGGHRPAAPAHRPLCGRRRGPLPAVPRGSTNTVSRKYGGDALMGQLKEQAEEQGWRWVDWNVSAEDAAGKKLSAEEVCRNVTGGSAGLERCIVLMHDSATTGTTAEALPSIIRWYKEEGYAFCTVSQLYDALE